MNHRCNLLVGALLSASIITVAVAAEKQDVAPSSKAEASAEVVAHAESGMRAYVDPETGALTSRPVTAEQRAKSHQADAGFREDTEDLQIVRRADGAIFMDLQGRFQQATVATVQSDDSIKTYCSDADHLKLGKHEHEAAAPVTATSTRDVR